MDLSKLIKEYFGHIWPETLGMVCSILIFFLTGKQINIVLAIVLLLLMPIIGGFLIRLLLLRNSSFFNEKTRHLMVSNLNQIRREVHSFPQDNSNGDRFAQTMVSICDIVCRTIIGTDDILNCNECCVIISLGGFTNPDNKEFDHITPLYSDNSKMSVSYMKIMGGKSIPLEANSPYSEIYKAYVVERAHQPRIITTSNVRKKARNGSFQSSFVNLPGFGYKKIPYNSSCVLPILPFHNDRTGNEMQGYVAILSSGKSVFKDSGITNKDFESFLESLSGLLHEICKKDKSKDNVK